MVPASMMTGQQLNNSNRHPGLADCPASPAKESST
jgi:hypothetical protein